MRGGCRITRLAGKMFHHSLDDRTMQFEMVMVMSGVGSMARLMRVVRCCIDKPTLSWRFKLDNPQQKLAVPVDADHHARSCRGTRCTSRIAWSSLSQLVKQRLLCHRASQSFTLQTLGFWNVDDEAASKGIQRSSASGTTKRSGVGPIKHVDTRHLCWQEILREALFGLCVRPTQTCTLRTWAQVLERHQWYHCASDRGLGWLRWWSLRAEAVSTSDVATAACTTMHSPAVDTSTAVHCWWIFSHMNLVFGHRGCDLLVHDAQDQF